MPRSLPPVAHKAPNITQHLGSAVNVLSWLNEAETDSDVKSLNNKRISSRVSPTCYSLFSESCL